MNKAAIASVHSRKEMSLCKFVVLLTPRELCRRALTHQHFCRNAPRRPERLITICTFDVTSGNSGPRGYGREDNVSHADKLFGLACNFKVNAARLLSLNNSGFTIASYEASH